VRIFKVWVIEEIVSIRLRLKNEAVGKVELSPQGQIDLVERKASRAIPSNIVRTEEGNSGRSRNEEKTVERFCRTSIEDRIDGPVAKNCVS